LVEIRQQTHRAVPEVVLLVTVVVMAELRIIQVLRILQAGVVLADTQVTAVALLLTQTEQLVLAVAAVVVLRVVLQTQHLAVVALEY
jgi:hypothetical protein